MPEYTDKLNLTKLQDNEYYDGNVENENLDKIDEAIGNRIKRLMGRDLALRIILQKKSRNLLIYPMI